MWLVLCDQLPAPSYPLSGKHIVPRTKERMEKISLPIVCADFTLFPGSHVAALTVVPKLAPYKGEGSLAASGGD